MLRINVVSTENAERLELEGRLTAGSLAALESAVAGARRRASRVALDLSELTFLDADGARLLRELRREDLELHGGSLFVAELLGLGASSASARGDRSRGGPCSR